MRSETQQQTSRRRRGGRRHKSPRGSGSYSSAHSSTPAAAQLARKPAKKGFFQRLLALFKGKPETPGKAYGRVLDTPNKPDTISIPNRRTAAPSGNGNGNGNGSRGTIEIPRTKAARKPELLEVTSAKLYVGNLSFDATEIDLSELFAGVGSVQVSEVVSHRETQKSKGFAFVTMSSVEEARRAVTELHDKEFMGRRLVVSGAKTSDVR
jgi:RNA recognition motif-containing protein